MSQKDSGNKLGTMPEGKLLASMSLPMMASFFIQALYNIVDSMFVARISENALTAVSLAFPMQQIMGSITVGVGVGISALVPRYRGMGKADTADKVIHTGMFIGVVLCLVFFLLGIFAVGPFYRMQTDVEEIVTGGITYLRIVWMIGFGSFFGQYFERLLTASGHASLSMASMAGGAVFNMIFDPILIFGLGPFPRMGIAGAAVATVSGQILAAVIALVLNVRKNEWARLRAKSIFAPSWSLGTDIVKIGFPSMVTMGLASLSSFLINQVLLGYSTTATAVYGIWSKLLNFSCMPAYGLNNAMVPILSYNYGAGSHDRVRKILRYALGFIVVYMAMLTAVFEAVPGEVLRLFSASDHMLSIGVRALRITVSSLVFSGLNVVLGSAMQALNHSRDALILNILKSFMLLAGSFWVLSMVFGELDMLWFALPLAEGLSLLVALFFYRRMVAGLYI
ncbi:MAG: MATE family efflux transporter [Eubacteriaceae bacterium]|nr:MATE family efflux transporter [Eubacteriaceae bacterium]